MIKLISLDLDGTLMHEDHMTVSEINQKALKDANEKGVTIVVASGRTTGIIPEVLCNPDLVQYHIASNGAVILDVKTKKIIHQNVIDPKTSYNLMKELAPLNLPIEIYADGMAIMGENSLLTYPGLPQEFKDFLNTICIKVDNLADGLNGKAIEKFSVFTIPDDVRPTFNSILEKYGPFETARSIADNVDVTAKNANKGVSLKALCDKLGIKSSEVMTFGDNHNDIEMLEFSEYSFAMGNASTRVKEIAKYTTKTNSESGVGLAINEYIKDKLI